MKLSYRTISNFPFQSALQKLANAPLSGRQAYEVNIFSRAIKEAKQKIHDEYKKDLMDKYAVLDEAGKYDPDKFVVQPTKEDEFEKEQEAFSDREYSINRAKLPFSIIANLKVSANDIEQLAEIVEMEDDEVTKIGLEPQKAGPQIRTA